MYSTIVQHDQGSTPLLRDAIRRIDDCLSVRDGALFVEEWAAEALARRFGTPLYVVSEDQLRRNVRRFHDAFARRWPGEFVLLPSIKANSCLALRRILSAEGAGCDVFGPGELEAALRTGTDPDAISLNGPMKDEALLERAIRNGVRITLDSRAEIDRTRSVAARLGTPARIRFRFRPDLATLDQPSEMSPDGLSIREAIQRYKAGIPTEDLLAVEASTIADPNLDVTGIMFHLGRHSTDPELWTAAIDALAELIAHLRELWDGWTPRELDIGGGFPAPRDPFGRRLPLRADAPALAPGIDEYAAGICPRLVERLGELAIEPEELRLKVEPGRALYADAGVHLATVGNVKSQTTPVPLTWIETDSSDAYLADVNLEFNRWTCVAAGDADGEASIVADVTGRTCALDVIVADAQLPAVEAGDVVAFLDTGAYQDAGATNFNALPRPGTALVRADSAEMIRRHETIDEIFARDSVPARLRAADEDTHRAPGWRATGLDHVSVTSGDLERSLVFYRDLLGLELRDRGEAEGASEFEITGISEPSVRWADLELPHGQVLELLEFVEPRGRPVAPRPNDPGATHIALRVADIDAVHARLSAADVPIRGEPVELTEPGAWQGAKSFYAGDPDGVTVELIQTPAGAALMDRGAHRLDHRSRRRHGRGTRSALRRERRQGRMLGRGGPGARRARDKHQGGGRRSGAGGGRRRRLGGGGGRRDDASRAPRAGIGRRRQRGHRAHRRPRRRSRSGRMAAGDRGQPDRCVPDREGGDPPAARSGGRLLDPDLVGLRPDHVAWLRRLQRLQARGDRAHAHACQRAGARRRHRQRDLSGLGAHADARSVSRCGRRHRGARRRLCPHAPDRAADRARGGHRRGRVAGLPGARMVTGIALPVDGGLLESREWPDG